MHPSVGCFNKSAVKNRIVELVGLPFHLLSKPSEKGDGMAQRNGNQVSPELLKPPRGDHTKSPYKPSISAGFLSSGIPKPIPCNSAPIASASSCAGGCRRRVGGGGGGGGGAPGAGEGAKAGGSPEGGTAASEEVGGAARGPVLGMRLKGHDAFFPGNDWGNTPV